MEIVYLWHVAEQDVSLAAQDWGQEVPQRGIVHLCPVALKYALGTSKYKHAHHHDSRKSRHLLAVINTF